MDNPRNKISKGERIGIVILIIMTFGVVAVGAWQIHDVIFTPFELHPTGELEGLFDESQAIDELRKNDTDNDGLSDFDELYVHGTSPYLPDTDSDGMSDEAEILAGKDPNCPAGQDCYTQVASEEETEGEEEINLTEEEKAGLIMDMEPSELRELLIGAGVPQEQLDQVSDEDLKNLVSQILAEEMQGATSTQE